VYVIYDVPVYITYLDHNVEVNFPFTVLNIPMEVFRIILLRKHRVYLVGSLYNNS
jgi:hypothetical protein